MATLRAGWGFAMAVAGRVMRHGQLPRASQFAYVAFIAFIPFAFVVVSIANLVGTPDAYAALVDRLRGTVPQQLADFLDGLAVSATAVGTGQSILFLAIGVIAGVWLAGNVAGALTDGLDDAFERPHRPWLRGKARAILLAVVIALVLVATTVLTVLGPAIIRWAFEQVGAARAAQLGGQALVIVVGVGVFWGSLVLLYRVAPNSVRAPMRAALAGGAIGAVGWFVATYGFRLYVDNIGSYNRVYGTLGVIVIFLVFLYLSGLTILIGGEATAELAERSRGRHAAAG